MGGCLLVNFTNEDNGQTFDWKKDTWFAQEETYNKPIHLLGKETVAVKITFRIRQPDWLAVYTQQRRNRDTAKNTGKITAAKMGVNVLKQKTPSLPPCAKPKGPAARTCTPLEERKTTEITPPIEKPTYV